LEVGPLPGERRYLSANDRHFAASCRLLGEATGKRQPSPLVAGAARAMLRPCPPSGPHRAGRDHHVGRSNERVSLAQWSGGNDGEVMRDGR
jgi:hypothetical protein